MGTGNQSAILRHDDHRAASFSPICIGGMQYPDAGCTIGIKLAKAQGVSLAVGGHEQCLTIPLIAFLTVLRIYRTCLYS